MLIYLTTYGFIMFVIYAIYMLTFKNKWYKKTIKSKKKKFVILIVLSYVLVGSFYNLWFINSFEVSLTNFSPRFLTLALVFSFAGLVVDTKRVKSTHTFFSTIFFVILVSLNLSQLRSDLDFISYYSTNNNYLLLSTNFDKSILYSPENHPFLITSDNNIFTVKQNNNDIYLHSDQALLQLNLLTPGQEANKFNLTKNQETFFENIHHTTFDESDNIIFSYQNNQDKITSQVCIANAELKDPKCTEVDNVIKQIHYKNDIIYVTTLDFDFDNNKNNSQHILTFDKNLNLIRTFTPILNDNNNQLISLLDKGFIEIGHTELYYNDDKGRVTTYNNELFFTNTNQLSADNNLLTLVSNNGNNLLFYNTNTSNYILIENLDFNQPQLLLNDFKFSYQANDYLYFYNTFDNNKIAQYNLKTNEKTIINNTVPISNQTNYFLYLQ